MHPRECFYSPAELITARNKILTERRKKVQRIRIELGHIFPYHYSKVTALVIIRVFYSISAILYLIYLYPVLYQQKWSYLMKANTVCSVKTHVRSTEEMAIMGVRVARTIKIIHRSWRICSKFKITRCTIRLLHGRTVALWCMCNRLCWGRVCFRGRMTWTWWMLSGLLCTRFSSCWRSYGIMKRKKGEFFFYEYKFLSKKKTNRKRNY